MTSKALFEDIFETESMIDPNRKSSRNHWADLAEQLGLAPEAELEPPSGSLSPPDESAESEAEAPPIVHEFEPEHSEEPGPAEPEAEPAPVQQWRPTSPEAEPTSTVTEEASGFEGPEQTAQPMETAEAEEKRPRLGRRRGRRSGRGTSRREETPREPAELEAEPGDEPAGERLETERRRGRGRSRSKSPDAESAEATPSDVAEGVAEEADEKDEELDNLSDWNVPSWNELIASLYRPER
jgi:hypothetical protein